MFNKTTNTEIQFQTSYFPDGTSQLNNLNLEPKRFDDIQIIWYPSSDNVDNGIFHVCQLGYLLWQEFFCEPTLVVPWLPYGRQDKAVNNKTTFAKEVFVQMIKASGYRHIETYDAHSPHWFIKSRQPVELIEATLPGHHVVCFPDAGAKTRYLKLIQGIARNKFQDNVDFIWAEKTRDQQTGRITGLELKTNGLDLADKNVLVF